MVRTLLKAANRGDLAAVEHLLDEHPGWAQKRYAQHAVCTSARRGDGAMVALLHRRGFDLDSGTLYGDDSAHTDLERPLHWAAAHGHASMVRWLLDHGADVNASDVDGMPPPLHRAATTADRIDLARQLLKHGADRTARARDGRTPRDCARAKAMRALLA